MAGYKETPRQKMIGMMYLVLTALLALNVSKDILNAFVIVNQGLITSQVNTSSKNDLIYSNFAKASMENPGKVKHFYDKALQAQKYALDLSKYIHDLRTKIVAFTEFGIKEKSADPEKWEMADTIKLSGVEAKDNYDKPMQILIGQSENGSAGEGMVLKNKLETFKKNMLMLLDLKKDRDAAEKSFPINTTDEYSYTEEKVESWVMRNFYHTVLAADVALLNKFLIDVKTVEGDVIAKLFSAVDASSFKFDQITAKVIPESNYILSGSEYKANIFLAAYDSKKSPDIYIGDTITHVGELLDKTQFENGMGVYKRGGSGIGEQKYTGWISIVKPGETNPTYYNFNSVYTVGQPSATVSADKMNVFYVGVENPVTISVPGASNDKVHASMTASTGTLTPKGNGKYIVTVSAGPPNTTINVVADIGGKPTSMGSSLFRIKKVPNPVPKIGGISAGVASKSVLMAAKTIVPVMENFDFELFFKVISFTMTMNISGDLIEENAVGNTLTSTMITKIKNAKTGTKIYLENIKAFGAGETRLLPLISLRLTN
jgi:gliding motility-associated protein GldM